MNNLSFWEKHYSSLHTDFLIVGCGYVGLFSALALRDKFHSKRIVLVDKELQGAGASTKNAGFACFGSPTELLSDLKNMSEDSVLQTFEMRYRGIQNVKNLFPNFNSFQYVKGKSFECVANDYKTITQHEIEFLNDLLFPITKTKMFEIKNELLFQLHLKNYKQCIENMEEGGLNPMLLYQLLLKRCNEKNIEIYRGCAFANYENQNDFLACNFEQNLQINTRNLIFTTNAYTNQLIQYPKVIPARNHVFVTNSLANSKLEGTIHADSGYIYLRNMPENRILIGGARNQLINQTHTGNELDREAEEILRHYLIYHGWVNEAFQFEYKWIGHLGVGDKKMPIIEEIEKNVFVAVRMGGMGVAISSEVGRLLSENFQFNL
jgi:glycine/D-amino acid oxidase-like deaminating enzyme